MMNVSILSKPFAELTPYELYDILRLRSEIFVVEQNCVFLEPDGKDQDCDHLMIRKNGVLVATTRLVPPGKSYNEMSIGRVVTHQTVRGEGVGKLLMEASIKELYKKFGVAPIRIGAQLYLKRFYESFGFRQCSDIYDEDGIDHILMLKD
jgi:ElaA protein